MHRRGIDVDRGQPEDQRAEEPRRRNGEQRQRRGAEATLTPKAAKLIPDDRPGSAPARRWRTGPGARSRRIERRMDEAPQSRALDRAVVRRRLDRGRAVVALAVRHALAALQRRGMTELRVVAHRGVDVEHARFADEGVAADLDRSGMDEVRLRAVAQQDGVLAQDGVVADRHHVGADRDEPAPRSRRCGRSWRPAGADRGCRSACRRTRHRRGAHQGLDDPEAEIAQAPDRDRLRLQSADQHPLRHDGDRGQRDEGARRERHAAKVELDRAVDRRVGPLVAGVEDPQTEQR